MATKNQLLEQARQLGLQAVFAHDQSRAAEWSATNKFHAIISMLKHAGPCLVKSLRGIARKCKVIMGRNTQVSDLSDIYDKFHGQVQPNVVNDPCYQLDVGTCRTMPREELRRNARK